MDNVLVKIVCLCMSSLIYSMEPEELLLDQNYHQINFQTYEMFSKVPLPLQEDFILRTGSMWNQVGMRFSKKLKKIICIDSQKKFTDDELIRRYPWRIKDSGIFSLKTFVIYNEKGCKPVSAYSASVLALSMQKSIYEVVGPNNNKCAILYGQIEDLDSKNKKQDDEKELGFFGRLTKRFKPDNSPDPIVVPGQPLALHPDKNICAFVHEHKGLYLYNLDSHEQIPFPGFETLAIDEDFPRVMEFTTDDRLLMINRGAFFIYSLHDYAMTNSITSKELIGNSSLFRREFLDLERHKQTTNAQGDENEICYSAVIHDFNYSSSYADYIILKVRISYYKQDKFGNVTVKSSVNLAPFQLKTYYVVYNLNLGHGKVLNAFHKNEDVNLMGNDPEDVRLMWDDSIEIYRLRDFAESQGMLLEKRDAISVFRWNPEILQSYILIAAAHNWLQSKEKNPNEARSILSTLYHSENKWKLLLKSTYVNDSWKRVNPFKDIFRAIKQSQYTHITEMI